MKSFIAKHVISIFDNLRYYLQLNLLKCKENNNKSCDTFGLTKKYTFLYKNSIRKFDCAPTLKFSKMALNPFCDEALHNHVCCCCFWGSFYNLASLALCQLRYTINRITPIIASSPNPQNSKTQPRTYKIHNHTNLHGHGHTHTHTDKTRYARDRTQHK